MNRVVADSQSFEDAFEDEDVTGDVEDAFLFVTVLLSRFVEEFHEDRVVEELCTDDEPLHLLTDVDRNVPVRNSNGSDSGPADFSRSEGVEAA